MTIHFKYKESLQYPGAICNYSGMGKVTDIYGDADCKSCKKAYEAQIEDRKDRIRRAGKKRETRNSAIMAGQRKEGE